MIFKHPRIICAYSRRPDNMSLNYGLTESSLANRKKFLSSLGIDYRDLVCANQVHGANVKRVTKLDKGKGALKHNEAIKATDAFITNEPGIPLGIFTGDCLSVFIYDPKNHACGMVHCGWRSTKENILLKAVLAMQNEFTSSPKEMLIGFGPGIRQCCYEVGNEFKDYFDYGIIEKNKRLYLDLAGINRKQLKTTGVLEKNIEDCSFCTYCRNDEFFSFRKEGNPCGRIISVLMLKS